MDHVDCACSVANFYLGQWSYYDNIFHYKMKAVFDEMVSRYLSCMTRSILNNMITFGSEKVIKTLIF